MTSISHLIPPAKSSTPPSARQKREQASAATIVLLAETFPRCFSVYQERRYPLKLGIHLDIEAALNGTIATAEIYRALRRYCSNPSYLGRLCKGAERLDLDGKPAGAVSDDEAARARARLARIKAKKANRAAAANPQAPPIERLSLADLKAAAVARKETR